MLWMTTMVVDDPDHRDLNIIAPEMLAAGGRFFGREIRDKEVVVRAPVREGQVNVGVPEVIEPLAASPAPPKPVAAARPSVTTAQTREPRKKFDLPAGNAATTLLAFSRQSGEQIIFPIDQLRAIKTHRITGEMSARVALDRMLAGTGFNAVLDEKTGAFVVR